LNALIRQGLDYKRTKNPSAPEKIAHPLNWPLRAWPGVLSNLYCLADRDVNERIIAKPLTENPSEQANVLPD
jgi:hypothetical protein